VLAILIAAPTWAWAILAALASSLALWEFYGLVRAAGWVAPRNAGLLLHLAILYAAYRSSAPVLVILAGVVVFLLPTLVLFSGPKQEVLFPSSAASVLATLYVAGGAAAMIGLRAIGWKPVILLLAVVWVGDSAAYYVGRRWGKKKLAPVVSPKKTWAGMVGQVLGGALVCVVMALLTRSSGTALLLAAPLGAALSVIAAVGDLVESSFKRSAAVKDSGGLLPGHGGLLDRLDSLLYASPALLLIATLLPDVLPK
jgi:phosphatidate cytidylyltransferase